MNPEPPARPAARRHVPRLVAVVLCAAAAALAVAGSFLPLFTATQDLGDETLEIVLTSMHVEIAGGHQLVDIPRNGYALQCGALLLASAAVACWSAAKPNPAPVVQRAAGVLTAAGGAFLSCAVWMVTMQVSYWADVWDPREIPGIDVESSHLVGYGVLLAAAALGLAASVPALLPDRRPAPPAPVVDPDAPTPPYGISLPVPDWPAETVDPLSGHPPDDEPDDEPAVWPAPPIVIPQVPRTPKPPPGPAVPATEDPLAEPRHD
jgi:hypothetical protein